MNRRLLTAASALLLSVLSVSAREPVREAVGVRQTRREAKRSEGARIRLERTEHDFGDIARRGGEVTAVFRFRNEGTAPLVLLRVTTTCSCLKSRYSKQPVPPGGEGEIVLTYEPHKADPGTFHKVVQVLSNSASGREIITIRGNSLDR